jgi:microcystin-dependent protein
MSGSISLSMSQQFNEYGSPLSGGLLYFIEAGTTSTPQNAYQDADLTLPLPNPITLDQAGRIPQFYLADGSIKIRLTDSAGVQQLVADNILVIGPSSGGGGGGSVDATTILATGDVKARYGTGTLAGFVRCNARTIGSATSGASERANADTQALFEYLWGADGNLSVSGGRGASANADWSANKTLTLPDMRGRAIAGLDDMGNTSAGRLKPPVSGGVADSTVLGSAGGEHSQTLLVGQMPSHTHTGTTGVENTSLSRAHSTSIPGAAVGVADAGTSFNVPGATATTTTANSPPSHTHSFTTASAGSGGAHNNVQPTMVMTFYIKL